MRTNLVLMSLFAAFLILPQASLAATTVGPVMEASFTSSPVTSTPGSDGFVQISLKNTGDTAATDVKVTPLYTDPGIVLMTDSVDIGGLGIGDSNSALFKFSVPASIASGLYRMSFIISSCVGSSCTQTTQFTVVSVQSQSIIELRSVTPSTLNVGGNTTLIFNIVNNGNSDLTNVVVTWSEQNSLILPLGSSNRIIVKSIPAGGSVQIPVNVVTSPSIIPGTYPISVSMSYFDKTGGSQNVTSTVGLIVGGGTEFSVDMQDFSAGSLTLTVANIGVNPATSVSANMADQEGVQVMGARTIFLGNLNSGDSTIATFSVASENATRLSSIPVTISYTDTSGLRESFQSNVPVISSGFAQSAAQRGARQNGSGNLIYYIVIILVIVGGVAYFLIRRRKKKRHGG